MNLRRTQKHFARHIYRQDPSVPGCKTRSHASSPAADLQHTLTRCGNTATRQNRSDQSFVVVLAASEKSFKIPFLLPTSNVMERIATSAVVPILPHQVDYAHAVSFS